MYLYVDRYKANRSKTSTFKENRDEKVNPRIKYSS